MVEVKQYYCRKELQYYIQSLSNVELNWKTIFQVQNILDIDKAKQNSLVQSIITSMKLYTVWFKMFIAEAIYR